MFDPKNLHGQVIDYSELKYLPKRIKYLSRKNIKNVNEIIDNKKPLLFQPTAITEQNLPELESNRAGYSLSHTNIYKKWYYKIILFGIFTDGRSASVVLTNIKPYTYVKIPDKYQSIELIGKRNQFKEKVENMLRKYTEFSNQKKGIDFENIEIVEKKDFIGYNNDKYSYFLKITFPKAGTSYSPRNKAIRMFIKNEWKTSTDDKSGYYKIPIRDSELSVSSWIEINDYEVITNNKYFKDKNIYVVDIDNIKTCSEDSIKKNPSLNKDKTMIMGWDIECVSKSGDLPLPENLEDKLFMICLDFQWYYSKDQLLRINLVDHPVSPHPEFISVICHKEKNILKAFAQLIGLMTPEYIVGFNDTGFDWPWLVGKAWIHSKKYYETEDMKHSVIEYMAKKMDRLKTPIHYYRDISFDNWKKRITNDRDFIYYTGDKLRTINNAYISSVVSNYRKEKIKIDSDTYHYAFFLQYNGYIAFDVRTIFRQLYPTSEKTSLNYFLTSNNLKLKEDMNIQEMFSIYWKMDNFMKDHDIENLTKEEEEQFSILKDKMKDVSYYCIIDSQRCPELVKKRNVIIDKQEVANLTYTSKYDAFYRANGMKIRNMIFPLMQKNDYIASNLSQPKKDEDKYPGAKVLNPETGLYAPKLTLRERIEKSSEFINEFGSDFNESYSLRDIPFKNLMGVKDLNKKVECIEKALFELNFSGVSLSKENSIKVIELSKNIYNQIKN